MGPRPFAFSFGFVLVVWLSWKEARKIYGFVKFTQCFVWVLVSNTAA